MQKPYYEDSAVTIYHGDCREIVPQLGRIDLLLTDPPFGIGVHGGKARTRGNPIPNHACGGWDNERPDKATLDLVRSCAKVQMIFGGNYFADVLPASRCWLYWRKLIGGDFADGELIWTSLDAVVREFTKPNKGRNNNVMVHRYGRRRANNSRPVCRFWHHWTRSKRSEQKSRSD